MFGRHMRLKEHGLEYDGKRKAGGKKTAIGPENPLQIQLIIDECQIGSDTHWKCESMNTRLNMATNPLV